MLGEIGYGVQRCGVLRHLLGGARERSSLCNAANAVRQVGVAHRLCQRTPAAPSHRPWC